MPSETVYLKDSAYSYAVQTKDEDQSIGKRLQELIESGIEYEERGSDVL
jgi:predicted CopG family antitoxin